MYDEDLRYVFTSKCKGGIYPNAFCILVFVKVQALDRMEMPNEHVLSMILNHFWNLGLSWDKRGRKKRTAGGLEA